MELYGFMEREKKIPSYFFIITKTPSGYITKHLLYIIRNLLYVTKNEEQPSQVAPLIVLS